MQEAASGSRRQESGAGNSNFGLDHNLQTSHVGIVHKFTRSCKNR
jgi:hypothetical protein